MTDLIVALVGVAVAFPAGWLVCRAWLNTRERKPATDVSREQHHAVLRAQRSRYRRQVQRVIALVRRHEAARDALRGKLDELETRLQDSRREADALRARHGAAAADAEPDGAEDAKAQAGLQRAASAERALSRVTSERDELLARVRQLEAELAAESQIGMAGNDSAQQKAARGALREKLAAAEHRGNELSIRVTDREARITELEQELESWKQHVVPLTRQIRSYRETLRNLQQPRPETPAKATAAGAAGGSPADRLQAIRGIGPALERRLNAQGIHCYAQLAALDPAELAHLAERLAISPTLPKRDCWIEQARALAAAPNGQTATA